VAASGRNRAGRVMPVPDADRIPVSLFTTNACAIAPSILVYDNVLYHA
jgi:hypothetical protein